MRLLVFMICILYVYNNATTHSCFVRRTTKLFLTDTLVFFINKKTAYTAFTCKCIESTYVCMLQMLLLSNILLQTERIFLLSIHLCRF